jgi:AraC family transcriptional regulator
MVKPRPEGERFYGVVVKQWRVGNLSFSESVFPPGARIRRHSHSHPYFSILLHGSYRETYSAGVRECGPATAVLHPPGEVHADHFFDAGGRIFRFEITDSESDLYLTREIWDTAELRNGRVRCLAARLYRESCNPDPFSPLAGEALALEIISEATRHGLTRDNCGTPPWLVQATELLHETLPENLTVQRIANVVGIHPVHLARVFRRRYGCSIGEYNHVVESNTDRCGKCGAEIDPTRRVDFTLKDATRVCESCFVKGTARPTRPDAKSA